MCRWYSDIKRLRTADLKVYVGYCRWGGDFPYHMWFVLLNHLLSQWLIVRNCAYRLSFLLNKKNSVTIQPDAQVPVRTFGSLYRVLSAIVRVCVLYTTEWFVHVNLIVCRYQLIVRNRLQVRPRQVLPGNCIPAARLFDDCFTKVFPPGKYCLLPIRCNVRVYIYI